jgi:hypothetical protein
LSNSSNRKKIIDALIKNIYPPNCAVIRAHAIESLGKLNAKEAISDMFSVLEDVHHLPRSYCIDALRDILLNNSDIESHYKDKIVSSFIEKSEKDNHPGVRAASNNALKKVCDLGNGYVFIKAKAVLWDTERREKEKPGDEEAKERAIREAQRNGAQKIAI